jgi:hypothetical protein
LQASIETVSISPSKAEIIELLPDPAFPIIAIYSPYFILRLIDGNENGAYVRVIYFSVFLNSNVYYPY